MTFRGATRHLQRFYRWVPRWLRLAFCGLLAIELAYVLVANVLVRTSLLRGWLSRHPEKLQITWASAWTVIPGYVHVRGFQLRIQDDNVQAFAAIDAVDLHMSLPALVTRTFLCDRVDAQGVTFLFRHKLTSVEGNEGRLAAYPKIPGFEDPPVRPKPVGEQIPEATYHKWTVDLREVTASAREIWVMEYRYRGRGVVTGGFRLKPVREFFLRPSVLLTHDGTLAIGDKELSHDAEGRIEATVDMFDTRAPRDFEVLRFLSARVELHGDVVSVEPFGGVYLGDGPVKIADGAGTFSLFARVKHGVLAPDTKLEFRSKATKATTKPVVVMGDTDFRVHVAPGDDPSLVADATTAQAAVGPTGGDHGAISVKDTHIEVDLGNADLTAPFRLARLTGEVAGARVEDLRKLKPLFPEDLEIAGKASCRLKGDYENGGMTARVDAGLEKVTVDVNKGKVKVGTSAKLWVNVASKDVMTSLAFPDSGLDLHDTSLAIGDATKQEGLWSAVRFTETSASPRAMSVESVVSIDAGPGDHVLRVFTSLGSLPDLAADAASGKEMRAVFRGRAAPGDAYVSASVKDGQAEGRGRLQDKAKRLHGAFVFGAGPATVGLAIDGHETSFVPFAGGAWLEAQLARM